MVKKSISVDFRHAQQVKRHQRHNDDYLEVTWMSEFLAALLACKPVLVVVYEHVIVQTVLTCECSVAD